MGQARARVFYRPDHTLMGVVLPGLVVVRVYQGVRWKEACEWE